MSGKLEVGRSNANQQRGVFFLLLTLCKTVVAKKMEVNGK
jgi:hypothetical protein